MTGRKKGARERIGGSVRALLEKARGHYAVLSDALAGLVARLRAGEAEAVKETDALLRSYAKAFQTALELEMKIEEQMKTVGRRADDAAIDLAKAREEVRRRLDRLRAVEEG